MSNQQQYIYIVIRFNCYIRIPIKLGIYNTLSGAKRRVKMDRVKIDPYILEQTKYYISVYELKQNIYVIN